MKKKFLYLLSAIVAFLLLNWLASIFPIRLDLTADKRYTLSDATQQLLLDLDRDVHITVYLSGDFPAGFERLENATKETLEQFRAIAPDRLFFQFVDPTLANSEEERQQTYKELIDLGISPTNLFANENGKRTERLIFPAAVVTIDSLMVPVQLLKSNRSKNHEEQLNQSYEGIEFQLASAIRELIQPERKKVGLLVSHTSIPPARLSDLIASLQIQYDVFLDMNNPGSFEGLDALMVLKPDIPFSEDEKFKLDQYVVNGGNLLLFIDGAKVDSIALEGSFAQPLDLNISDLLFKWGARINHNLVKDLNAAAIPFNVGNVGDRPDIQPVPWRFFPLLNNFGNHSITRNIDAIYTRFISTIDTIGTMQPIVKTPLLLTSPYTKTLNAPVLVSYNEARQQPEPEEYKGGVKIGALLLEGSFSSLYENRILDTDPRATNFQVKNHPGRVLVVSDGDVVVNDVDFKREAPLPLGYDKVTRNVFGNKDFVLLALDYMTDAQGLITARNREVKIRLLDKVKISKERNTWQLINVVLPILLISIAGALGTYIYRRKFR